MLYVTLRIAALDKRLHDETWHGLSVGRKQLLLPLQAESRLREGAQHVAKFNLAHPAIRKYVSEVLQANGRPPSVRLTVPTLVSRVHKLRATLDSAAVMRRVAELRDTADAGDRTRAAEELDELRAVLAKIAKALRGKR